MTEWKDIYIFISSTFNDMHNERDYLVKTVFPRLYEWCFERNLRLIEIDLRWGITSEESDNMNNRVVEICLDNIDKCRPFFLCLLGQRRGWVPFKDDLSQSTYSKIMGLEELVGKYSVTEMEVLHALIKPLCKYDDEGIIVDAAPAKYSFFLSRNQIYLNDMTGDFDALKDIYTNRKTAYPEKEDEMLEHFKYELEHGLVEETDRELYEFTSYTCDFDKRLLTPELVSVCGKSDMSKGKLTNFRIADKSEEDLSDYLFRKLTVAFEKEYPENCKLIASEVFQDNETYKHRRFIDIIDSSCKGRESELQKLSDYVEDDSEMPMLVSGSTGIGKTTVCTEVIKRYKGDMTLCYRFVGLTGKSRGEIPLIHSMMDELVGKDVVDFDLLEEKYDMTESDLFEDDTMLVNKFPLVLDCLKKKTLIIIDDISALKCEFHEVYWLPTKMSRGSKLIISCNSDDKEAYQRLKDVYENRINLYSIDDMKIKELIIDKYLSTYLKKLDNDVKLKLLKNNSTSNPQYLQILLSELKSFGSYDNINNKLDMFGTTVVEAFSHLLERFELDVYFMQLEISTKSFIQSMFSLIAASREGVTVDEIVLGICYLNHINSNKNSNKLIKESVYTALRQLADFVSYRDERIMILNSTFAIVIQNRYSKVINDVHFCIAKVFNYQANSIKQSLKSKLSMYYEEISYHYYMSGQVEEYYKLLLNYNYIYRRIKNCGSESYIKDLNLIVEQYPLVLEIIAVMKIYQESIGKSLDGLPTLLWIALGKCDDINIQNMLNSIDKQVEHFWLKPVKFYQKQVNNQNKAKKIIADREKYNRQSHYVDGNTHMILNRFNKFSINTLEIWNPEIKNGQHQKYQVFSKVIFVAPQLLQYKNKDVMVCIGNYDLLAEAFIISIKNRRLESFRRIQEDVNEYVVKLDDGYELDGDEDYVPNKIIIDKAKGELKGIYNVEVISLNEVIVYDMINDKLLNKITLDCEEIVRFVANGNILIILSKFEERNEPEYEDLDESYFHDVFVWDFIQNKLLATYKYVHEIFVDENSTTLNIGYNNVTWYNTGLVETKKALASSLSEYYYNKLISDDYNKYLELENKAYVVCRDDNDDLFNNIMGISDDVTQENKSTYWTDIWDISEHTIIDTIVDESFNKYIYWNPPTLGIPFKQSGQKILFSSKNKEDRYILDSSNNTITTIPSGFKCDALDIFESEEASTFDKEKDKFALREYFDKFIVHGDVIFTVDEKFQCLKVWNNNFNGKEFDISNEFADIGDSFDLYDKLGNMINENEIYFENNLLIIPFTTSDFVLVISFNLESSCFIDEVYRVKKYYRRDNTSIFIEDHRIVFYKDTGELKEYPLNTDMIKLMSDKLIYINKENPSEYHSYDRDTVLLYTDEGNQCFEDVLNIDSSENIWDMSNFKYEEENKKEKIILKCINTKDLSVQWEKVFYVDVCTNNDSLLDNETFIYLNCVNGTFVIDAATGEPLYSFTKEVFIELFSKIHNKFIHEFEPLKEYGRFINFYTEVSNDDELSIRIRHQEIDSIEYDYSYLWNLRTKAFLGCSKKMFESSFQRLDDGLNLNTSFSNIPIHTIEKEEIHYFKMYKIVIHEKSIEVQKNGALFDKSFDEVLLLKKDNHNTFINIFKLNYYGQLLYLESDEYVIRIDFEQQSIRVFYNFVNSSKDILKKFYYGEEVIYVTKEEILIYKYDDGDSVNEVSNHIKEDEYIFDEDCNLEIKITRDFDDTFWAHLYQDGTIWFYFSDKILVFSIGDRAFIESIIMKTYYDIELNHSQSKFIKYYKQYIYELSITGVLIKDLSSNKILCEDDYLLELDRSELQLLISSSINKGNVIESKENQVLLSLEKFEVVLDFKKFDISITYYNKDFMQDYVYLACYLSKGESIFRKQYDTKHYRVFLFDEVIDIRSIETNEQVYHGKHGLLVSDMNCDDIIVDYNNEYGENIIIFTNEGLIIYDLLNHELMSYQSASSVLLLKSSVLEHYNNEELDYNWNSFNNHENKIYNQNKKNSIYSSIIIDDQNFEMKEFFPELNGCYCDKVNRKLWLFGSKIDSYVKLENNNYLLTIDGQIYEMELKNS